MNTEHGDFNHLIPASFTAPIAAKILRTTPESLASLTRSGAILVLPAATWDRYSRREIERILGRGLTITEVWEAESAHRPRLEAHRRYNATRRTKSNPAPAPATEALQ